MVTSADSHISGADTVTARESDSHVANAQLDAIGDKPTRALNEGNWVSPRSKTASFQGKER